MYDCIAHTLGARLYLSRAVAYTSSAKSTSRQKTSMNLFTARQRLNVGLTQYLSIQPMHSTVDSEGFNKHQDVLCFVLSTRPLVETATRTINLSTNSHIYITAFYNLSTIVRTKSFLSQSLTELVL